MYSEELIKHPELQPLMKRFKKKFPKIDLRSNMMCLGWWGYQGMGLDVDAVKVIFEICLKENKYFKVWNLKWKGQIQCHMIGIKVKLHFINTRVKRRYSASEKFQR